MTLFQGPKRASFELPIEPISSSQTRRFRASFKNLIVWVYLCSSRARYSSWFQAYMLETRSISSQIWSRPTYEFAMKVRNANLLMSIAYNKGGNASLIYLRTQKTIAASEIPGFDQVTAEWTPIRITFEGRDPLPDELQRRVQVLCCWCLLTCLWRWG